MNKDLEIISHWYNESGDAEIVLVKTLVEGKHLLNNLFWFSGSNRLMQPNGTKISTEDFCKHKCYKMETFESVEEDVPNDCYVPL